MTVREARAPLVLEERPDPAPAHGEVRIRIAACGVCRSDLWILNGEHRALTLPRVPGHEVAGVIDAVGPGVEDFAVGERVGVGWHGGQCHRCEPCRRGDYIHCKRRKICGVHYDGGYADVLVAPACALARIPEALDLTVAAPLFCAGVTTFNALRYAGGSLGDRVAVEGLGGLGHLGVQFASKMGFEVVAVSPGPHHDLAKRLGARHYIDSRAEDPGKVLRSMGGASVILATSPSAASISGIARGLGDYGTLMIVGIPAENISINVDALVDRRASVRGWACGHAADSADTLAFAARHGIEPWIEPFPLERANEAVDAMKEGRLRFRAVLTTG
jgi:D-arabinose 1-dehydrogenase-like Zn-dependent alcohol dehydrogenase